MLLTILIWAGNSIVGRGIRDDMPPIALSFWRWVLAMVLLLPWAWRAVRADRQELRRHWRQLCIFGILGGASNNAMNYVALTTTTATNAVLLNSSTPILIITISWALLGKRLRRLEWCGVIISLAGVLIVAAHGELQTLLELRLNRGDLWVLGAVASWSLYTVLLARRPVSLHPLSFLAAIGCTGLLALAPFYAWEIASGSTFQPSPAALAAIAYAGIFPSLFGFIFWNRAVAVVGGNTAGLFLNLMPVLGTLLAILFLGEQPHLYHLTGILLILGGVTLTTRQHRSLKPS